MSSLKITVNGERHDVQCRTLAELCAALGYGDARVATALNGTFVPAPRRADAVLHDDDRIEIVAPRQGG
jgi:sulfur carrier protein